MLHYRLFGTFLTMFITCLILTLIGYTKQPTRTAVLEEKAAAWQKVVQTVGNRKQTVYEKKAQLSHTYPQRKQIYR